MAIKIKGNRIDFTGKDAKGMAELFMPGVSKLLGEREEERASQQEIKEGDKVTRKNPGKTYPDTRSGVVVAIDEYGKCKVRWEKAAKTGQLHSTVDKKALKKI